MMLAVGRLSMCHLESCRGCCSRSRRRWGACCAVRCQKRPVSCHLSLRVTHRASTQNTSKQTTKPTAAAARSMALRLPAMALLPAA
jgi:hypothetical protein